MCGRRAADSKNEQQANKVPSVNSYRMKYIQGVADTGWMQTIYLRVRDSAAGVPSSFDQLRSSGSGGKAGSGDTGRRSLLKLRGLLQVNIGQSIDNLFNVTLRESVDLDGNVNDLLNIARVISTRRVRVHQPFNHAFRVVRKGARPRRGCKRRFVPKDEQRAIRRFQGLPALRVGVRVWPYTKEQDSHRCLPPRSERARMIVVRGS